MYGQLLRLQLISRHPSAVNATQFDVQYSGLPLAHLAKVNPVPSSHVYEHRQLRSPPQIRNEVTAHFPASPLTRVSPIMQLASLHMLVANVSSAGVENIASAPFCTYIYHQVNHSLPCFHGTVIGDSVYVNEILILNHPQAHIKKAVIMIESKHVKFRNEEG
jgi:hypothetical protein